MRQKLFGIELRFLSKLVRTARALTTVLTNTNTKFKAFGDALSCRLAGQTFIDSRNICYKCWRSETEFSVSPTVQMPFLENVLSSIS